MSISPRERTGGYRYPRPPNPSPSPKHGSDRRRSPPASISPPAAGGSGASSESVDPAVRKPNNASEKVVGFRVSEAENGSHTHGVGSISERHPSEQGNMGFPVDNVGSVPAYSERPEIVESLPADNLAIGSTGLPSHGTQIAARKNQAVNANHLLNFQYDPISRPQPRGPRTYPPRRQKKIKPYNKDLFLQANYKFVVLDTGNYQVESMDPDKMLQWDDIVCVKYYSPSEVQCPICLDSPLCPQITSCGHIYCFPCILRYLIMGKEDYKGDCWKKCPLCFTMVSTKELCNIEITQVQHFHAGDIATFTLLSRSRNSLTPLVKSSSTECASSDEDSCNVFSKFILTSDVELSVRETKRALSDWLRLADLGLVDDMEKLPYVSAALEQLEERMKYWMEYRSYGSSPLLKDSFSPGSSYSSRNSVDAHPSHQSSGHKLSPVSDGDMITGISELLISPGSNKTSDKRVLSKVGGKNHIDSNGHESYTFYQVSDGQYIILHPLNMRCLLDHFGGPDMLPPRITGKILELETVTQSETTRKRYRFLSHFSLTTTFQFCEIDLSDMLPLSSLTPFMDEIKKREKQRKRTAKKEESERVKAEVAAAVQATAMRFEHTSLSHSHNDFIFSLDDFEALGNNAGPSTSPPASERKLFSDVTRLGFASAQDSPPLRVETLDANGKNESARDTEQGPSATPSLSFASIISSSRAAAAVENSSEAPKPSGIGKKGKKPTRVLLSTGGGRRY